MNHVTDKINALESSPDTKQENRSIENHISSVVENTSEVLDTMDYWKYRFCVIDDFEVNNEIIKESLLLKWAKEDKIHLYNDGIDFVKRILEFENNPEQFDSDHSIVLLDFHMPGMNGDEIVGLIRLFCRKYDISMPTIIIHTTDRHNQRIKNIQGAYVSDKIWFQDLDEVFKVVKKK